MAAPSAPPSASFAAPRLSFSLTASADDGTHRLGQLTFTHDKDSSLISNRLREIATPGVIAYTRRGAIPHLTRDNVAKLPLEMVHLSLEHLLEYRPPPFSHAPFGLHRFIGLHETAEMQRQPIITMSLRDATDKIELPPSQDSGISASTTRGVVKVSPRDFLAWTIPRPPDILISLDDDPVNAGSLSSKRLRKSVGRSYDWVEQIARGASTHTNVFAPLVGSTNTATRAQYSERLTQWKDGPSIDSSVKGYSLTIHSYSFEGAPSIPSLFQASLSTLPTTKPRLVLGAAGPHDILTLVSEVGLDLFVDEWASQCASLGVALDFEFPVGHLDATSPVKQQSMGTRDLGHDMFDLSFDRQFIPLSTSPLARPSSESGSHPFGPSPPTRGYVHHLLHSHEMTAHVILALHNELFIANFFSSIRAVLKSGPAVFKKEMGKFFETYQAPPTLFAGGVYPCMEKAKEEWEIVNKVRGKGSLKEKRRIDAEEEEERIAPREKEVQFPLER